MYNTFLTNERTNMLNVYNEATQLAIQTTAQQIQEQLADDDYWVGYADKDFFMIESELDKYCLFVTKPGTDISLDEIYKRTNTAECGGMETAVWDFDVSKWLQNVY